MFTAVWLIAADPALAATWLPVVDTGDSAIFVDAASLHRDGQRVSAWFLWDHSLTKELAGPAQQSYRSMKSRDIYDCENKQRAIAEAFYYGSPHGVGPVVGRALLTPRKVVFEDVVPDSVGDVMMKSVCEAPRRRKRTTSLTQDDRGGRGPASERPGEPAAHDATARVLGHDATLVRALQRDAGRPCA